MSAHRSSRTRREILTSGAQIALAAVASTAAVPAPAQSSSPQEMVRGAAELSPIGKLFRQWEAKAREVERLSAEWHEASRRLRALAPKVPCEMRVVGIDRLDLRRAWFRAGEENAGPFTWVPAEGWRDMAERPDRSSDGKPSVRMLERAQAALPVAEHFDALSNEADMQAGYGAASDAYDAAVDELWDLETKILALLAGSNDDLAAQAEIVRRQEAEGGARDGALTALLASIAALGGRA